MLTYVHGNNIGNIHFLWKVPDLAATESEMEELWQRLVSVDATATMDQKWVKKTLQEHPKLQEFMEYCCLRRHYSFCVKKCGYKAYSICKPPRLPSDVFDIKFLPDPVPSGDGHYKPFGNLYGKEISKKHHPSLQTPPSRAKTLPFVASVQHAHNTNLMVQCEECEMWHLIYSRYKLTLSELKQVSDSLEEFTYTCGSSFADLNFSGRSTKVCARNLQCYSPLEKLYYSLNKEPLCIYCCSDAGLTASEGCYPQCPDFISKPTSQKECSITFL